MADEVQAKMKTAGYLPSHIEGFRNAEWILLDFMDLVVHIFSKNARAFYDLERLWRDGKKLDVAKLLDAPPKKTTAGKAVKRPAKKARN
jgi:ribosome-associated protein